MKNKKQIAELTETATKVNFPKYSLDFERFKKALRDLVEANFGYSAAREMGYDEYSRTFYWEMEGSTVANLKGTLVQVKRHFSLDPTKPLDEEFTRLKDEYRINAEVTRTVTKAVLGMGGEV